MKILVAGIGKVKEPWVRVACEDYLLRLRPYVKIEHEDVKDEPALRKRAGGLLWVLDERGSMLSSTELSQQVEAIQAAGDSSWTLALGGPDGFSPAFRKDARFVWSLSPLTLPYQLARVVVLEQLYRAFSILHGGPYHRA